MTLEETNQLGIVVRTALEEVRAQHRRQEQRHDQRNRQSHGNGQRQRAEHLAFNALQRHQRQEHQNNDGDTKDGGRSHFHRGRQHSANALTARIASLPQLVEDVFNHHHGRIHHQANGDGQPSQRHQVGRDAVLVHHDEGRERRNDQRRHNDQAGAHIAQEDKQHDHHQEDAFNQHLAHGPQSRIHQIGTVVVRNDLQAAGQHALGVDLVHAFFHAGHHFLGIAAAHHQHNAGNAFGIATLDDGALAHFGINLHLGHITHIDRHPTLLLEHDVANIFQRADHAHAANQILLCHLRQNAAAGIGVVICHGLNDLTHCQIVVTQTTGIDQHLVLLDVSTLRVDFSHTRNGAQQRTRHPVLNGAALGQLFLSQRALTIIRVIQRVLVNLTQTGRHRTQHRHDAFRHARCDFDQALCHQLASEVHIRRFSKHQRNDGQTALVERAQLGQTGQARHGDFERHSHKTLNFFR